MNTDFLLHSPSKAPPLRIGLLLDTPVLSCFFAEVVGHIVNSDFAKIELLIYNNDVLRKASEKKPPKTLAKQIFSVLADSTKRRRILFDLYRRFDARNVDPATDPDQPVDCSGQFIGIKCIRVKPENRRFVQRIPGPAIQEIREAKLDVLFRIGFKNLRGEILQAARFGVWSYHHGDHQFYRGGPAYFWEMLEKNPNSVASLQVFTAEVDAGLVLCRGLFSTQDGISRARNRIQPFWGSTTFAIQKLRELHAEGWPAVKSRALPPLEYCGKFAIYSVPSNVTMLNWIGRHFLSKVSRRLSREKDGNLWRIAIRRGPLRTFSENVRFDGSEFAWVDAPPGRFFADPFVVDDGKECWLFFEDYHYSRNRAQLSCAPVGENALGEVKLVMCLPHHLSYPYVFRDHENWYLVPESVAANKVSLYRATRFPTEWVYHRDILDGRWVDPTIWVEQGRYWLFVTSQEPRGFACQLWLFSAESLEGPWVAHPRNPISTDARYARSAGAVFRSRERLIRPSQDCSGDYGRRIIFNEICVLTPEEYFERPICSLEPEALGPLRGTHTYNRSDNVEVVDGKWPVHAKSHMKKERARDASG